MIKKILPWFCDAVAVWAAFRLQEFLAYEGVPSYVVIGSIAAWICGHILVRSSLKKSGLVRLALFFAALLAYLSAIIVGIVPELLDRRTNKAQLLQSQTQFYQPSYLPPHQIRQQLYYARSSLLGSSYVKDGARGTFTFRQWHDRTVDDCSIIHTDGWVGTISSCTPYTDGVHDGYMAKVGKGKAVWTAYVFQIEQIALQFSTKETSNLTDEEIRKILGSLKPVENDDIAIKRSSFP